MDEKRKSVSIFIFCRGKHPKGDQPVKLSTSTGEERKKNSVYFLFLFLFILIMKIFTTQELGRSCAKTKTHNVKVACTCFIPVSPSPRILVADLVGSLMKWRHGAFQTVGHHVAVCHVGTHSAMSGIERSSRNLCSVRVIMRVSCGG